MTNPQKAELALEAIRNGERVADALRPLQLLYPPALLALVVYALFEHTRFILIVGAAFVGSFGLTWLLQRQRRRKLRAAAAATRAQGAAR